MARGKTDVVSVMEFIRRVNAAKTVTEVAQHYKLTPSAVSQKITAYEKKGYAIVRPSGGQRGRKLPSADEINALLEQQG